MHTAQNTYQLYSVYYTCRETERSSGKWKWKMWDYLFADAVEIDSLLHLFPSETTFIS